MPHLEIIKIIDQCLFLTLSLFIVIGLIAFTWYAVNQTKGGQGDDYF